eukprot:750212-Prymnesium_polylepis.2
MAPAVGAVEAELNAADAAHAVPVEHGRRAPVADLPLAALLGVARREEALLRRRAARLCVHNDDDLSGGQPALLLNDGREVRRRMPQHRAGEQSLLVRVLCARRTAAAAAAGDVEPIARAVLKAAEGTGHLAVAHRHAPMEAEAALLVPILDARLAASQRGVPCYPAARLLHLHVFARSETHPQRCCVALVALPAAAAATCAHACGAC